MVETLAETLKDAQAKRHSQKQGDVEIEALINIMADHLKAEILIDTLGDTLAEREAKTFATHREMCRPTPWSKRWLKR